ncbi:ABC transporter ATP-binding protein [Aerococcaceae bacterium zg-ZJ1578]|uniref:ABC transporter ATP-binding protein n=1 Tax=Aerococcaceae bacterium zg-252 TaxID=2796928 RepID=UPI001A18B444|nr:ABC transporter ATP-binding protein [Aerococcaceae bacterium zg-1578]
MEIRLNHINKRFGKHIIFEDVSTYFPSGQMIGLIGPNGIGKTTLIRMMFNLDSQYEGDIYFDNRTNKDVTVFKDAYFMQDNRVLYPQLTAYDHLRFLVDVHQINLDAIERVVEQVGIKSYLHKKVESYSLGMKQHLLIAMALIHQPQCIVMDEPFNGLDPTSIHDVKMILKSLKRQNKTIIMSSHNLSIIQELVDRVYLVKDKKLVNIELNKTREPQLLIQFNNNNEKNRFIELVGKYAIAIESIEDKVHIIGNLSEAINLLIAHQIPIKSVEPVQFNIEELYKEYYL